ncbi:MAG: low-specificity L-threonine aldolase [Kluyvera cryocrescens]|nr:low-specificity L-threonine aldolase [Kluyvera cryocrescens]
MIDLRSDTVTRPTRAMLDEMVAAPVGDDVYGDDPTVNALQQYAAELAGKEAALFLPTGTQANLVALLSHCERGEEYIVGQGAHNYLYEAGGAAVLGSIQPQPIDAAADGTLPLDKVAAKIKADDIHFARTKLLSIENTHNGKVLPQAYLKEAWEFTRQRGLALHVDGARIFNALVAYGCELKEIAQYCDSFTICLSKGLGTPVGSLLVGNRDYIKRANRWRKMTGGGMRQAGFLAAAGLYALKNNVARLQDDHDNAAWLAEQLREIGADVMRHDTNMLFVRVGEANAAALGEFMQQRGVLINASPIVRLVTHLDVSRQQLAEVVSHWKAFLAR